MCLPVGRFKKKAMEDTTKRTYFFVWFKKKAQAYKCYALSEQLKLI